MNKGLISGRYFAGVISASMQYEYVKIVRDEKPVSRAVCARDAK